jgi:O-succinylbenzoate synthase|tara:strand:+ start:14867 stop:15898 length:1032 start_codon:yes stop_codon:yes gene_type:complete
MKATYKRRNFLFKIPGGTSRGVLHSKDSWFLTLTDDLKTGLGECSIIEGLSIDDLSGFESKLEWLCLNINKHPSYLFVELSNYPSIVFGLEMALRSLNSLKENVLFSSDFTEGKDSIPINGLVWMGEIDFMKKQVESNISKGYNCIKLKIGALDFDKEFALLKSIRDKYDHSELEIRLDANGAYSYKDSMSILNKLSKLSIHSIEQPIKAGQIKYISELCLKSPIPIALDEELIGVSGLENKIQLLDKIKPQYIILKPSLLGGFKASEEWIKVIPKNTKYWVTSALESNVGLSAISQWAYTLNNSLPQGLGTGSLFSNNFASPLSIKNAKLHFNKNNNWNINI